MDLVDFEEADGELGFGEAVPLRRIRSEPDSGGTGEPAEPDGQGGEGQQLITWLPPVGSTVARGGPLFRVDDQPVTLLFGQLPTYRRLTVGVKGGDVKQLEENLRAMHFGDLTPDESFTTRTATALKRWQRALGVDDTGVIDPGQVVFAPAAIRIATHTVRVGDLADGEILRYTGTAGAVTVPLTARQQGFAEVGTRVVVTLRGGETVDGTVERVNAIPPDKAAEAGGDSTAVATVKIANPAKTKGQQGPVTVRFIVKERGNVLTVPVVALVALAEGGYGVQVLEAGNTRFVAVETGLFANGRVEIKPGELTVGAFVVVPT